MPFWHILRRPERNGMPTHRAQGARLSRQANLMLGMTGRYSESARKNEDEAAAVEEKVNGRSYCG